MDGAGVHHPIGTNGIAARTLRSNNGRSVWVCVCLGGWVFSLLWRDKKDYLWGPTVGTSPPVRFRLGCEISFRVRCQIKVIYLDGPTCCPMSQQSW